MKYMMLLENQFFRLGGDGSMIPTKLSMIGFLRWKDAWRLELERVQDNLRMIRLLQLKNGKLTRAQARERTILRAEASMLNRMRQATRRTNNVTGTI